MGNFSFQYKRILNLELDKEDVYKFFLKLSPRFSDFFYVVLTSYSNKMSKAMVCEKTPAHLLYVPLILRSFPKARIVCMIRDGRDVVTSLMRKPFEHKDVRKMSHYWRIYSETGSLWQIKYPEHFFQIKYEDLLSNPEKVLKNLVQFLDIDFQEKLLNSNIKFDGIKENAYWVEKANMPLDSSRIGQWKKSLSPSQKSTANKIMENSPYHFDYPIDSNDGRGALGQFPCQSSAELLYKSGLVYKIFKFIFILRMQVNKKMQKTTF